MDDIIDDLISRTKTALLAAMDAELDLMTNKIDSYTIDTDQNRQVVTRLNISQLRDYIDNLMNRCATLQARKDGSGTVIMRPGY